MSSATVGWRFGGMVGYANVYKTGFTIAQGITPLLVSVFITPLDTNDRDEVFSGV